MPSLPPRRDEGAFGPYARAVRRHPWLVGGIMVVALLVAGAWIAKRPHQYQATAQILVTPSTGTTVQGLPLLTESVDPTRTLQTAATILSSPKAALEAAGKLGGGWTPKKISDTVKVVPQGDSNIIAVTAKETSSAAAVAAANASARAALKVRSDTLRAQADAQYTALEDQRTALGTGIDPATATSLAAQLAVLQPIRGGTDPNFQLQQPAGAAKLTGTSTKLILFLALMAGLVIGTAAALLLEQIDQRVRDEDDLLERYPLPVLARVPMSRRRGGGDGDPAVTPDPAIREAFRTLQVQLDEPGDEGRVIMLTSASMGDGKTTSAINLARALVAAGHRVVLLDLDLRKPDVGARLGVSSDVLGLFRSNVRLSDLLVPVPSTRALKVLSAPPRGDISPVLEALSRRLPELLAQARELADYVVIDTAPLGRVSDALRIAAAADDVLLVARPGNTDGKELTLAREQMEHMDIAPSGLVVVGSTGAVRSDYYGYVTDTPADVDGAATSLATLRSAAPAARQQQRRERGGERLS
ncbi:MAG TPA: AAA family ATPase [Conexibacter sp.]|nr:AAA family ATPase [Conexibacter sp.]